MRPHYTFPHCYSCWTAARRRWRHYDALRHREALTSWHSITLQKTGILFSILWLNLWLGLMITIEYQGSKPFPYNPTANWCGISTDPTPFLQDVGNHWCNDMVSHLRRTGSSTEKLVQNIDFHVIMVVLFKMFVIFWIPTPCSVILFWRNLLLPPAGCLNLYRCILKWCGGTKGVGYVGWFEGMFSTHWLETSLLSLLPLHSCNWPNSLKML